MDVPSIRVDKMSGKVACYCGKLFNALGNEKQKPSKDDNPIR